MALQNLFGGLALDETLKSLIDKFRDKKEPLFITNGEDPFVVESRPRTDPAITSVIRPVTSVTTAQLLAGQNNNRSALSVTNSSTSVLYLLAAPAVVTSTLYTVALNPGDYWEMPQGPGGPYKGAVTGIWVTANGTALVTEYSA